MNPFFIFLFICAAGAIIYWFKNASTHQGVIALKAVFIILGLVIIVLVVTNRLPLISGIPLIGLAIFHKFTLQKVLIPFITLLAGRADIADIKTQSIAMTDNLALDTLGLTDDPSREEIVQAHRRLVRDLKQSNPKNDSEMIGLDLAREHLINKK
jgi:hypothetical protein